MVEVVVARLKATGGVALVYTPNVGGPAISQITNSVPGAQPMSFSQPSFTPPTLPTVGAQPQPVIVTTPNIPSIPMQASMPVTTPLPTTGMQSLEEFEKQLQARNAGK